MTGRAIAALLAVVIAGEAPARAAGLTSPEPLARAYELILDARYDEAEQQLRGACGPAPSTGCLVLRAVSAYWQLLADPNDTSHDVSVLEKINAAIASADA